ncbi:hypothetical protein M3Y95_00181200 [Aphelenchoides besseyi]|nr:hypothetical protein M3Y95_00181200 [Aphelenchoides besseyi]
MSDSDSDVEKGTDQGSSKQSRPPKRGAASKPVVYSGSSDESEEEVAMKKAKPRAKKPRKERSESPFPTDLFEGIDKEKVSGMNELEREMVVYKRMEENEIKKQREEIRQKMLIKQESSKGKKKAGNKKTKTGGSDDSNDEKKVFASSSESEGEIREPKVNPIKTEVEQDDDPDMDYHRPSEVHEKRNKKKAMDALISKRRDKKQAEEKKKEQTKKDDNKAVVDFDAIFGGSGRRSASSSDSSRTSSRSSSLSSRTATPEPETNVEVHDLSDLNKCKISRTELARFVHLPFFQKLAIGCFVRVGIGANNGKPVYRMAEIVDVVETAKVYSVENTRTNKGFKLKYGKDQRVYRLEFVSNSDFLPSEHVHWLQTMRSSSTKLPTMEEVERKQKEIAYFNNYQLASSDIDFMIKEKQRFQKTPTNFAIEKSRLMKEKADAEEQGNLARVKEIQQEIDDLDFRADEAERTRNSKLSAVTWINQKRRVEMKQNFLDPKKIEWDPIRQDDPFTRKSNRTKVVSGSSKKKETTIITTSDAPSSSDQSSVNSQSIKIESLIVEETTMVKLDGTPRPKIASAFESFKQGKPITAQFNHHMDIELDLDI